MKRDQAIFPGREFVALWLLAVVLGVGGCAAVQDPRSTDSASEASRSETAAPSMSGNTVGLLPSAPEPDSGTGDAAPATVPPAPSAATNAATNNAGASQRESASRVTRGNTLLSGGSSGALASVGAGPGGYDTDIGYQTHTAPDDEERESYYEAAAASSAPEPGYEYEAAAVASATEPDYPDDVFTVSAAGRLARLEDGYAVVTVYYGTDRQATGERTPSTWFGGDRGTLSFGTCEVSIPLGHQLGELESPSWLRLEFTEDPREHVVLLGIEPQDQQRFLRQLAARVAADPKRRAFVFVHGYNVGFADAARRTAQIAYDIGFRGAPILYSWPSQDGLVSYTVDENNARWTEPDLTRFLRAVLTDTPAEEVYLIAHSMGNRPLTSAFIELKRQQPALAARVREVILTAPDIDADVFRNELAPKMAAGGTRLTLYASADDKALLASKKVHGYPRAGDAGAGIVVLSSVETVDASGVDTSFLGHSYFAETRSVLADILLLVREGRRASERTASLVEVLIEAGRYWRFR